GGGAGSLSARSGPCETAARPARRGSRRPLLLSAVALPQFAAEFLHLRPPPPLERPPQLDRLRELPRRHHPAQRAFAQLHAPPHLPRGENSPLVQRDAVRLVAHRGKPCRSGKTCWGRTNSTPRIGQHRQLELRRGKTWGLWAGLAGSLRRSVALRHDFG